MNSKDIRQFSLPFLFPSFSVATFTISRTCHRSTHAISRSRERRRINLAGINTSRSGINQKWPQSIDRGRVSRVDDRVSIKRLDSQQLARHLISTEAARTRRSEQMYTREYTKGKETDRAG